MWNSMKHWIDAIFAGITAGVLSSFTWLNLELPHITTWLSFVSMLLSMGWWVYRYYGLYKGKKHGD